MGRAIHWTFYLMYLFVYTDCVRDGKSDYRIVPERRVATESATSEISASLFRDIPDTRTLAALGQRTDASMHIGPPTMIPEHRRRPRLPKDIDWRHDLSLKTHLNGQDIDNGKQAERQPASRIVRPFKIRLHYTACSGKHLAYRHYRINDVLR